MLRRVEQILAAGWNVEDVEPNAIGEANESQPPFSGYPA
jgi:hypothetical protein